MGIAAEAGAPPRTRSTHHEQHWCEEDQVGDKLLKPAVRQRDRHTLGHVDHVEAEVEVVGQLQQNGEEHELVEPVLGEDLSRPTARASEHKSRGAQARCKRVE